MGDLYLHLAFARRLRFAEGMHPLVREAMVRRSPFVALGATLRFLPDEEQRSGSFLRRLFKLGRNDANRWIELLTPKAEARPDLVAALLAPPASGPIPGPLTRLALAMGALSHELLSVGLSGVVDGVTGLEREAVLRGQARLWLQSAIPVQRHLQDEWAPALHFITPEPVRPMLSHIAVAMGHAFGQGPQRELVARWAKCLAQTLYPLAERSALPEPGTIPDHVVREQYFDGDAKFLERTQDVTTRAVFNAGRIGELFIAGQPSAAELTELLVDGGLPDAPETTKLEEQVAAWNASILAAREEAMARGRNPRAAYHDDPESSGPLPPLPSDGAAPNVTQEVSLAQIEAEVAKKSPAMTQEVSLAQIESEAGGPVSGPPTTDPGADGAVPPRPPANTQQVSLADIETEVANAEAAADPSFRAPANTQQVSLADIEAEVANASGGDAPAGFKPPAHTQQVALVDIEAELENQGGTPPAAPAQTQAVALADIEAEVASAGAGTIADTPAAKLAAEAGAATPATSTPPSPPATSAEGPPVLPPQSSEGPPESPPISAEGPPAPSDGPPTAPPGSGEGAPASEAATDTTSSPPGAPPPSSEGPPVPPPTSAEGAPVVDAPEVAAASASDTEGESAAENEASDAAPADASADTAASASASAEAENGVEGPKTAQEDASGADPVAEKNA